MRIDLPASRRAPPAPAGIEHPAVPAGHRRARHARHHERGVRGPLPPEQRTLRGVEDATARPRRLRPRRCGCWPGTATRLRAAVIAYDYGDLGWVQGLGVRRPWRRRGLGGAMLAHAFAALAAARPAARGARRGRRGRDAAAAPVRERRHARSRRLRALREAPRAAEPALRDARSTLSPLTANGEIPTSNSRSAGRSRDRAKELVCVICQRGMLPTWLHRLRRRDTNSDHPAGEPVATVGGARLANTRRHQPRYAPRPPAAAVAERRRAAPAPRDGDLRRPTAPAVTAQTAAAASAPTSSNEDDLDRSCNQVTNGGGQMPAFKGQLDAGADPGRLASTWSAGFKS